MSTPPLTSVTIGEGVEEIGKDAFASTQLTSVTIPDKVENIGNRAFYGCKKLATIDVGGGNTKYSATDGVLFNKDGTELILYPPAKEGKGYEIPNSVTTIGQNAFFETQLASVEIPDGVTTIGYSAFYKSQLTIVKIPKSTDSIGGGAFSGCMELATINVDPENANYSSKDGVLFDKDKKKLVAYPPGKGGSEYAIPNSVTTIGRYAFSNAQLASVTIPGSVTTIEGWAFNSARLTSLEIPGSVTTVGEYTFTYCQIASLVIREGVTTIGYNAFFYAQLTSLEIPAGVTTVSGYAFFYCKIASLEIPAGVTFESNAFYECESLGYLKHKDKTGISFGDSAINFGDGEKHTINVIAPEGFEIPESALEGDIEIEYFGLDHWDMDKRDPDNGFPATYAVAGVAAVAALVSAVFLYMRRGRV